MKYTIIAECGINHNGDMNYAKKSIEIAKECGADIWKTQLYNPESLFPDHKVIVNGRNWYSEVCKTELSFDQVSMLKKHCDKIGIEFIASAFDETRLQWLEMLHVYRHKIASKMNNNIMYIEKVTGTGKQILISGDNGYMSPILLPLDTKFLYCVPKYPTYLSELSLDAIETFQGFSDHTIGIEGSVLSMALNCGHDDYIIEKHFTLDRSEPGCDQSFSVEPNELLQLVRFAKAFEEITK